MNALSQFSKAPILSLLIALTLVFVAPLPVSAIHPTDTYYGPFALYVVTTGLGDTAIGYDALRFTTTGSYNTGVGTYVLHENIDGNYNTAIGVSALYSNTSGIANTANGTQALSSSFGSYNTATGYQALSFNGTAYYNTATGAQALLSNRGPYNTATGYQALRYNGSGGYNTATGFASLPVNTTGFFNTADGVFALFTNSTGYHNLASGVSALYGNTTGHDNTAVGFEALGENSAGSFNTATGLRALLHTTGASNVGIGANAGLSLTTGSGNVCIGVNVLGVAGESNTTRIRNIYPSVATARAVYVNADNKIGTLSSSRRFKEDINPMDKASETLFALKPVTFRYKKDVDPARALSFGLIAEEVAEISPELITRDDEGNAQTVRYEAVNAMLLNEFLKEHKKVEQQEAMISQLQSSVAKQEATGAHQQEQIEALTEGLQKVSAQLQASKRAPQTVVNNR